MAEFGKTSRERPKLALYLRLKIVKGGPFGLCETPFGCKTFKKLKGDPWEILKNFRKKFKKEIFEQCHSAEKCKRGDPLGFFDLHCVAKYRNKRRGNTLVESKKLQKKVV